MKKLLLLLVVLMSYYANSQTVRLEFSYDDAGNQISRVLNFDSQSARNTPTKNLVDEINDEDLLKFSEQDILSYYPNPVKEQLYLKWELIDENKVNSILVFSYSGQLVKSINNLGKEISTIISFQDLPVGTFLVHLNYSNGKQESITIIKK